MNASPFNVVTYNIHRAVGLDGRCDPGRIAAVLKEIQADIIGLQEVDTGLFHESVPEVVSAVPPGGDRRGHPAASVVTPAVSSNPIETSITVLKPGTLSAHRVHQLAYLTQVTGYTTVEGLLIKTERGEYGNALLTRHPVRTIRRIDLTIRGAKQRRGALDVDIEIQGKILRVIVTHLGLGLLERFFQVQRVVQVLGDDRETPILIMGDFNLWPTLFSRFRRLQRRLGHAPRVRTFPANFPILSLDRLWLQPIAALKRIQAHISPMSRMASDHLPLVGTIQFTE